MDWAQLCVCSNTFLMMIDQSWSSPASWSLLSLLPGMASLYSYLLLWMEQFSKRAMAFGEMEKHRLKWGYIGTHVCFKSLMLVLTSSSPPGFWHYFWFPVLPGERMSRVSSLALPTTLMHVRQSERMFCFPGILSVIPLPRRTPQDQDSSPQGLL